MPRTKSNAKLSVLDALLGEASWLVTHADALACYGRKREADAEWLRAAECEKDVACLLEAENRELDAAIHYVSAASCFAHAKQHWQAVPLLRSALSFTLRDSYRREVEGLLKEWLPKAKKQLRMNGRKSATVA